MENKKAVSLPINIIVMMIIGITLFSMGLTLFSKFVGNSNDELDDLNNRIETEVQNTECKDSSSALCVPTVTMSKNQKKVIPIYITNDGSYEVDKFKIETNNIKKSCGEVIIKYFKKEYEVKKQTTSSIPFNLESRIKKTPCNLIGFVSLKKGGEEVVKTPLIINIK